MRVDQYSAGKLVSWKGYLKDGTTDVDEAGHLEVLTAFVEAEELADVSV